MKYAWLVLIAGLAAAESASAEGLMELLRDAPLFALSPGAPVEGKPVSCPSNMARIGAEPVFCMDVYEAPNIRSARPYSAWTAPEGETWCRGRGKRLCTSSEWKRACQGPQGFKYPYGNTYEAGRCNTNKKWRLVTDSDWELFNSHWDDPPPPGETMNKAHKRVAQLYQAIPSGDLNDPDKGECVSAEGVYDLVGNAIEWTDRTNPKSGRFPQVMMGGYWSGRWTPEGGSQDVSCDFANGGHPGSFRSYEAGFRCCCLLSECGVSE